MGGALAFVFIMLAVAAAAAWTWYARQRRRGEIVAFGLQFGLDYSRVDPSGMLVDGPFRLFQLGDGRTIENVLSGEFQGMPLREADYAYYEESNDSKGHRTKTWHRFSVVVSDLPLTVPEVIIERENLLEKVAERLSFHDLEFESEEFNRMFNVKAGDREFAFKLVDARMMRWLLSTGGAFGFETNGSGLLVWCKRRRPMDLVPLLGSAKLFRDHIPRLVWNEFGNGEGGDVPETASGSPREERSGS